MDALVGHSVIESVPFHCRLVQEKFATLMVGQETYAKRKVLAGIVMTFNGELDEAKVISVSTGTKCINGEYIR